ncbi:MAG: type IV pilus twitching motility protein PilT [Alphaproteobacteria bacterium]|nr:type IV pilus twitching motility protein PilT [Alphaproteobacteria bacterium]
MEITELLLFTQKNNGSDLHITSNSPPIIRIHGDMMPMKLPPLSADDIKNLIYSIMTEQQRADYERDFEIDFSISFSNNMRFRVNAFNTISGPAAVFRDIPTKILTLDQLGAPEILKKLTKLHKGLILVTGPTGSGKSTTLAAMVDLINSDQPRHILTVEDPVEFVHQSKQSLINQREVGASTKSFARALKSALREDPDVILVGEMRDLETIQLAITAAETGHLVMGTLHTNSAPKTIDRIIDVFPADNQEMIRAMLSESLQAVITQTLLKKADGTGRVAAHEILLATPAIRNLIREAKTPQIASLMQIGSRVGMCTLKDAVYKLVEENVITKADAKSAIAAAGADDSDDNDELTNLAANKTNATTGATPPKATAAAAPAPQRPSQSPRTSSGFGSDNNSF